MLFFYLANSHRTPGTRDKFFLFIYNPNIPHHRRSANMDWSSYCCHDAVFFATLSARATEAPPCNIPYDCLVLLFTGIVATTRSFEYSKNLIPSASINVSFVLTSV